jgi:hypothetical protein
MTKTKTTKEAKGVHVKVRPENIIYNVSVEEANKMLPFKSRAATMDKRIRFLIEAVSSLKNNPIKDKEDEQIINEAVETLIQQTTVALDNEYALKPSNVKQSMEEFFGNRFIPFCGADEEEPEKWGQSEAIEVRNDRAVDCLPNEIEMFVDPSGEKNAKDVFFEGLQQNIDKKYKRAVFRRYLRDKKGKFASRSTKKKGTSPKKIELTSVRKKREMEKLETKKQKEEEAHKKYCGKIDNYFKREKKKLAKKTKSNG